MERKYIDFGFTMSPEIPKETALEIVAIKQVLMSIVGKLPKDARAEVLKDLSAVDSNIMRDIVSNIQKIN